MKTAEDILEEICPNRPFITGGKTDQMIIKCMQEHARQVAESVKVEAAKIAFEGVDVEYNITFMDIEKFIK